MRTAIAAAIISTIVGLIAATSANAAPLRAQGDYYEDYRNTLQYVFERAANRSK